MTDDTYADALSVKIASTVLREQGTLFDEPDPEFWFVLSKDFVPPDNLPCYYPCELPFLATKTPAELRMIYNMKMVFPAGRVKS